MGAGASSRKDTKQNIKVSKDDKNTSSSSNIPVAHSSPTFAVDSKSTADSPAVVLIQTANEESHNQNLNSEPKNDNNRREVDEIVTEDQRRGDRNEDIEDEEAAFFFAHTAMSLGMESEEDLLFNLMYFEGRDGPGDGPHAATFGAMMDNVQQETLALHSTNNTPYKLRPASESAIAGLNVELYDKETHVESECAVCRDEMECGCSVVKVPACGHVYHEDCLVRWIKLQGWCPVCRADIVAPLSSTELCTAASPQQQGGPSSVAAAADLVSKKLHFDCDSEQGEADNSTMLTYSSQKSSPRYQSAVGDHE